MQALCNSRESINEVSAGEQLLITRGKGHSNTRQRAQPEYTPPPSRKTSAACSSDKILRLEECSDILEAKLARFNRKRCLIFE